MRIYWKNANAKGWLIGCAFVVAVFGCRNYLDKPATTIVIPEGKHSPTGITVQSSRKAVRSYYVRFDSTAIYYHRDSSYQDSWNKLPGQVLQLGWCSPPHHHRAELFAFRWYKNQLQVGSYRHEHCDSTYKAEVLGVFEIGQTYLLQISTNRNRARYRCLYQKGKMYELFDTTYTLTKPVNTRQIRWHTHFYFGGIYPAPHDIRIFYDEI